MYGQFAAWLPQINPDVLCVQEVTHTHGHTGWTSFDDGDHALPQRADLLTDVRRLLPRHQAFFAASDAGPVRDATGVTHQQEFGVSTFVHSSIAVTDVVPRFVHDQFTRHERWPLTGRPRNALATRLALQGRARAITVVQVHGLRDAEGKHDTPARRAQAERLAALVTDVRQAGDLAVLCGDLNLVAAQRNVRRPPRSRPRRPGRHRRHPRLSLRQAGTARQLPARLRPPPRSADSRSSPDRRSPTTAPCCSSCRSLRPARSAFR